MGRVNKLWSETRRLKKVIAALQPSSGVLNQRSTQQDEQLFSEVATRYGSGDWMQHQYIPLPEEWPSEPDGEFDRRPYGLDEIFEVVFDKPERMFLYSWTLGTVFIRILPPGSGSGLFDLYTVSPGLRYGPPSPDKPIPIACPDEKCAAKRVPLMEDSVRRVRWFTEFLTKAVTLSRESDTNALAGLVLCMEVSDGLFMAPLTPDVSEGRQLIEAGLPAPVLTLNKRTIDHRSVDVVDRDFITTGGYHELKQRVAAADSRLPFQKRKPVIFWRSSAYGRAHPEKTDRVRAALISRDLNRGGAHWLDARLTNCDPAPPHTHGICRFTKHGPGHGIVDDGGGKNDRFSYEDQLQYRYLLDIDGQGSAWTGAFWKLLTSESVVFKVVSGRQQWWYPRVKPWVHFIPVRLDYSDLWDKFQWAQEHPEDCIIMARNSAKVMQGITEESEVVRLGQQLGILSEMYRDQFRTAPPREWLQRQTARLPGRWEHMVHLKVRNKDNNDIWCSASANSTAELDCEQDNQHGGSCLLKCKVPCDSSA